MLSTIISFIVILSSLILVHELGHFISARRMHVKVEEFGLGLPPRLMGKKIGQTIYSFNALFLGGFVKIKGEEGEKSDEKDSLSSRPVWQRLLIIASGVTLNVIAGFLILIVLFNTGMPMEIEKSIPRSYVKQSDIVIFDVLPGSEAAKVGLKNGDIIRRLDEQKITNIETLQSIVASHADTALLLTYERNKKEEMATVTPAILKDVGGKAVIGVALAEVGIVNFPFWPATKMAVRATYGYLQKILLAFVDIIKQLLSNEPVGERLGGPVAIAAVTRDVVSLGWPYVLLFTAILSFNLAIINILPFPALDGGRILFLLIAKLRGKPSRREVEEWFHRIGFALLMLLVLLITYHDLVRIIK